VKLIAVGFALSMLSFAIGLAALFLRLARRVAW
jgi:hypothetical protein